MDELSQLIASVDPDGSVPHAEVLKMYKALLEDQDDDSGAQMDLASFLYMCHTHSIGRHVGSLAQRSADEHYGVGH